VVYGYRAKYAIELTGASSIQMAAATDEQNMNVVYADAGAGAFDPGR
jgi:hypothetical protein